MPRILCFFLHRFLWRIHTVVNGDIGVSNRTWTAAMSVLYSQCVDNFIKEKKKKGGWRGGEIWIIFLVIWFTIEKVTPCKKRQSSLWDVWRRSRNGRAKMGGTPCHCVAFVRWQSSPSEHKGTQRPENACWRLIKTERDHPLLTPRADSIHIIHRLLLGNWLNIRAGPSSSACN